jgi:hypothetical protein
MFNSFLLRLCRALIKKETLRVTTFAHQRRYSYCHYERNRRIFETFLSVCLVCTDGCSECVCVYVQAASDFRLCKWPLPLDHMIDGSLARYFDELNLEDFQSAVANDQDECQIITFSHFLPRYDNVLVFHFWSLIELHLA